MQHVASWFQAALLPARWRVAGVTCSALSVWHVYVLRETGNAYLTGQPPDRDAAAALLLYCSRGYLAGRRLFTAPLYRRRAVLRIARKLRRQDWPSIDAAVCDYLETCGRVPGHKEPAGVPGKASARPRRASAPLPWALVDSLSRGDPRAFAAAWDTPFSVARCLFDARRDLAGEVDTLESAEEEARFDEYLARRKEGAA